MLSEQELGGVDVHTRYTGHAHFVETGEARLIARARELLHWLPANHSAWPPVFESADDPERSVPQLEQLLPPDAQTPSDIRPLIQACADEQHFFEMQAEFAPNLVTGFASFGGQSVAVVANQSLHLSGAVDPAAARKYCRFLNFIASFNYPLISFLDVPGAMPALAAQQQGMLSTAAQIIHSLYHVRALKISLVVRRMFGGTYAMISPKSGEGDLLFAYPQAMIGVMSDAAMKQVLAQSAKGQQQLAAFAKTGLRLDDPLLAAASLYLDDIFEPAETRREIIRALQHFARKRVQHFPSKLQTNPPL
ncbi:MAG: hypothetical protein IGS03_06550 [Candidatus Sericytochromatia bacterium]|nr:hypothetical protein [Candidatus Sericytochromatia bacterium]